MSEIKLSWSGIGYERHQALITEIGLVSIRFNALELSLRSIFVHFMPSARVGAYIFEKLSGFQRKYLFPEIINCSYIPQPNQMQIREFFNYVEIAISNRNIIAHSFIEPLETGSGPTLRLSEFIKKNPIEIKSLVINHSDLKTIANDFHALAVCGHSIYRYLFRLKLEREQAWTQEHERILDGTFPTIPQPPLGLASRSNTDMPKNRR